VYVFVASEKQLTVLKIVDAVVKHQHGVWTSVSYLIQQSCWWEGSFWNGDRKQLSVYMTDVEKILQTYIILIVILMLKTRQADCFYSFSWSDQFEKWGKSKELVFQFLSVHQNVCFFKHLILNVSTLSVFTHTNVPFDDNGVAKKRHYFWFVAIFLLLINGNSYFCLNIISFSLWYVIHLGYICPVLF